MESRDTVGAAAAAAAAAAGFCHPYYDSIRLGNLDRVPHPAPTEEGQTRQSRLLKDRLCSASDYSHRLLRITGGS